MKSSNKGCVLFVTGIDSYFQNLSVQIRERKGIQNAFYHQLIHKIAGNLEVHHSEYMGDREDGFALFNKNDKRVLIVFSNEYSYDELFHIIDDTGADYTIVLRKLNSNNKSANNILPYLAQQRNIAVIEQAVPEIKSCQFYNNFTIINNTIINNYGNVYNGDVYYNGGGDNRNNREENNNWLSSFLSGVLSGIVANIITGACPFLKFFCQ